MINLRNDYNTIGDEKILEELVKYSDNKYIGYGEDEVSNELKTIVREKTKSNADCYVLPGGTATNVIGLSQMLKYPYEAVITVSSSHINVHETGALESSGHKIIYTPSILGKVDIKKIEETFNNFNDNHMVMPKALYLSNATELGETYSLEELKEISTLCKRLGLYFFLDGARLPVAMASEGYSLSDIASICDMFYLGGTKIGLPYGELLIIVNEELKNNFKYLLKNKLGLLAKGFVGSIMFKRLLQDDYYLDLANKEIKQSDKLRKSLIDFIVYPNKTNQVFIKINYNLFNKLKEKVEFEVWEKHEEYLVIRFVTSIKTSDQEIRDVIKLFKE